MKPARKAELILLTVLLAELPAWANNPPQPDGMFSIILIFPIAILGFRLAGAVYSDGDRKWRWLRGLVLMLAVLLSAAGTEIALFPLLILLVYGCARGVQIIARGRHKLHVLIGAAVCLWTLFAIGDYFVSLMVWSPVRVHEAITVGDLRRFAKAEELYAAKNDSHKYATLEQLRDADTQQSPEGDQLNYEIYLEGKVRAGYRFSSSLDSGGRRFFIAAVPAAYERDVTPLTIPGASWLYSFRTHQNWDLVGQRCFAIDESGVIRTADLGMTRVVTRVETEKWAPLQ